MKSFEGFSRKEKVTALSLSLIMGLGVSACSSEASGAEEAPRNERVEITYLDDGTRYTESSTSSFQSFCDGSALIDMTYRGGISRSVDHAACEDGQLTPEDFALNTAE